MNYGYVIEMERACSDYWTFTSSLFYSGVVAFFGLGVYYLTRRLTEIQVQEKIVFACFFAGAIVCMGLSFLYHTLCCHNNKSIGRLFAKYVIFDIIVWGCLHLSDSIDDAPTFDQATTSIKFDLIYCRNNPKFMEITRHYFELCINMAFLYYSRDRLISLHTCITL